VAQTQQASSPADPEGGIACCLRSGQAGAVAATRPRRSRPRQTSTRTHCPAARPSGSLRTRSTTSLAAVVPCHLTGSFRPTPDLRALCSVERRVGKLVAAKGSIPRAVHRHHGDLPGATDPAAGGRDLRLLTRPRPAEAAPGATGREGMDRWHQSPSASRTSCAARGASSSSSRQRSRPASRRTAVGSRSCAGGT
jgi:hypothetical protein